MRPLDSSVSLLAILPGDRADENISCGVRLRISPYAIAGVWGQPPPSQQRPVGRQPANGEAGGLPEAMLAFTKYLSCEV